MSQQATNSIWTARSFQASLSLPHPKPESGPTVGPPSARRSLCRYALVALLAVALTTTFPIHRRRRAGEDPAEPSRSPAATATDFTTYLATAPQVSNRLALTPGRANILQRRAALQPRAGLALPTTSGPPTPAHRQPEAARAPYTSWQALNAAITHIPNYRPDIAQWVVEDKGAWGATDLDHGIIYIAPRAPQNKLFSIAVHEYSHALAGHLYGSMATAQTAADTYFGQHGEYGLEIEADCMALLQGATWTDYTSCADPHWQAGARALLLGRLLASPVG